MEQLYRRLYCGYQFTLLILTVGVLHSLFNYAVLAVLQWADYPINALVLVFASLLITGVSAVYFENKTRHLFAKYKKYVSKPPQKQKILSVLYRHSYYIFIVFLWLMSFCLLKNMHQHHLLEMSVLAILFNVLCSHIAVYACVLHAFLQRLWVLDTHQTH